MREADEPINVEDPARPLSLEKACGTDVPVEVPTGDAEAGHATHTWAVSCCRESSMARVPSAPKHCPAWRWILSGGLQEIEQSLRWPGR